MKRNKLGQWIGNKLGQWISPPPMNNEHVPWIGTPDGVDVPSPFQRRDPVIAPTTCTPTTLHIPVDDWPESAVFIQENFIYAKQHPGQRLIYQYYGTGKKVETESSDGEER